MSSDMHMLTYCFDPLVPAELELFAIDVPIFVLVEHGKHLLQPIRWYHVDVALVIPEQCPADQCELVQRQPIVSGIGKQAKERKL